MTIDETTIRQIACGDERAFAALYDAYHAALCGYAFSLVADRDAAGLLVGNVFIAVWRNRAGLTFPATGYLFRAVRNQCLNYLRDNRYKNELFRDLTAEQIEIHIQAAGDEAPEEFEPEQISRRTLRLRKLLERLPKRCRQVMKLYFYEGFSPSEISEILDINQVTVRVHIKNGIDFIRSEWKSASGDKKIGFIKSVFF